MMQTINDFFSKDLTPEAIDKIQELMFAGIGLSGKTNTNLEHLAVSQPDLLEELLDSVMRLSRDKRHLWSNTLSISYLTGTRSENTMIYHKWMKIIDFTEVLFPTGSGYSETHLSNTFRLASYHVYRDEAPVILAHMLTSRESQFKVIKKRDDAPSTIQYIAENIEAILPIVPELMDRRDASLQMIKEMLSADSVPLRNGLL